MNKKIIAIVLALAFMFAALAFIMGSPADAATPSGSCTVKTTYYTFSTSNYKATNTYRQRWVNTVTCYPLD